MMARVTALLFGLAGVLLPVGVVLSHRNVPVVLVLIGLAGLAAFRGFRPKPWMTAVYAVLIWAAASTLWSPYGNASAWVPFLILLGGLGSSAMLAGGEREAGWMSVSVLACLALLGLESATGGLIRDIVPPEGRPDKDDVATARGITVLLCLMPGFMLYQWRYVEGRVALKILDLKPWILVGYLLIAGICAASFGIAANLLAYIAGIAAAVFVYLLPKWGVRLVLAGAILPILLMPLVAMAMPPVEDLSQIGQGPESWIMRLIAWKALWGGVADSPLGFLFGHGVEGARIYGESLGKMTLASMPDIGINMIPTHPHNVYLQIWFDLGLAGAVLFFIAMLMSARALLRSELPKPVLMAVVALIAGTAIFALTDASLWTQWRVAGPLLGGWLILVAGRAYRGGPVS